MPAFAAAAALFFGVLVYLLTLRASGGWLCLLRLRMNRVEACRDRQWSDLSTIERGWFYGVPFFTVVAIVFVGIGIGTV